MERSKSRASDNNNDNNKLEASLLQLIHDYNQTSHRLKENTEKAKKEAIKKAARVSDVLLEAVNGGVEECYVNQKRIELEIRALTTTAIGFAKQTDQWLAASHNLNTAIKEIGDIENWMKIMEFDCKSINAAISNIYCAIMTQLSSHGNQCNDYVQIERLSMELKLSLFVILISQLILFGFHHLLVSSFVIILCIISISDSFFVFCCKTTIDEYPLLV